MTLGQVWLRSTLSPSHLRLTALRLSRPVSSSIGETQPDICYSQWARSRSFLVSHLELPYLEHTLLLADVAELPNLIDVGSVLAPVAFCVSWPPAFHPPSASPFLIGNEGLLPVVMLRDIPRTTSSNCCTHSRISFLFCFRTTSSSLTLTTSS